MKNFYIYESAYDGGLFWKDHLLTHRERYNGDFGSDQPIAIVSTPGDVWRAVADEIDVNGSGGWTPEYIAELITEIPWEEKE